MRHRLSTSRSSSQHIFWLLLGSLLWWSLVACNNQPAVHRAQTEAPFAPFIRDNRVQPENSDLVPDTAPGLMNPMARYRLTEVGSGVDAGCGRQPIVLVDGTGSDRARLLFEVGADVDCDGALGIEERVLANIYIATNVDAIDGAEDAIAELLDPSPSIGGPSGLLSTLGADLQAPVIPSASYDQAVAVMSSVLANYNDQLAASGRIFADRRYTIAQGQDINVPAASSLVPQLGGLDFGFTVNSAVSAPVKRGLLGAPVCHWELEAVPIMPHPFVGEEHRPYYAYAFQRGYDFDCDGTISIEEEAQYRLWIFTNSEPEDGPAFRTLAGVLGVSLAKLKELQTAFMGLYDRDGVPGIEPGSRDWADAFGIIQASLTVTRSAISVQNNVGAQNGARQRLMGYLQENCQSCHAGPSASGPSILESMTAAVNDPSLLVLILQEVDLGTMPPESDRPLSAEEKVQLTNELRCALEQDQCR